MQAHDALFVSGIRTIAANLKIPVEDVTPDVPYASSFAFESLSTALVVPAQGGRFTMRGHALWQHEPPEIVLQTEDRSKVVARFEPSRAKDQHSFSATLDGEVVAANAGARLDLMIGATVKRDVLFSTAARRCELHFPMCLPGAAARAARWTMSAGNRRRAATETRSGSAGAKTFYFENCSCSERRAVSVRLVWDGLGPEDRLGRRSMTPGDLTRGNSSVDVTINGRNAVTTTGWLDRRSASTALPDRSCSIRPSIR